LPERRTTPRRKFSLYLRVMDDDTQAQIGHMVDISPQGLQLETSEQLPVNRDYYLKVELTSELADRPFMVFLAKSIWSKEGRIPMLFHTGFHIVEIMPDDKEVFLNILKKYGS